MASSICLFRRWNTASLVDIVSVRGLGWVLYMVSGWRNLVFGSADSQKDIRMLRSQAQHTVCAGEKGDWWWGGNISLHFGGLKWAGKSRRRWFPTIYGVYPRYCWNFQEPNSLDGTHEYSAEVVLFQLRGELIIMISPFRAFYRTAGVRSTAAIIYNISLSSNIWVRKHTTL